MFTRPHASVVPLLLLLAACHTPPAPPPIPPGSLAQDQASAAAPQGDDEGWKFGFAPYLWAAEVHGHTDVRGRTIDVDVSFGDIWDDLNYALQGVIEARNGNWSILFDNTYMSLTSDANISPGPGAGLEIDADLALWISELAGLRRLGDDSPYELGAGLRYTEVRSDVHIATLPGLHDEDSVTDGIVVGRGTWPLSERWGFRLYADAGTGDSDFTWQSAATFLYAFDGWKAGFGYRVLDYEFGGSNDTDIQLRGLIVGIDFRF